MRETALTPEEYLEHLVADGQGAHDVFGEEMHAARYRFAASRLPRGGCALDVGCATGYGSQIIAEVARRVIGVDYHATAAAEAQRRTRGLPLSFLQADAMHLPLADDAADGAVALDVVEHLPTPELLLAELARIVRPGGVVVLSTPNKLASDLVSGEIYRYHIREYYLSEFAQLLRGTFSRCELFGQYPSFTDDIRQGFGVFRRRSPFWFIPSSIRRRVPSSLRRIAYASTGRGSSGEEPAQIGRMKEISTTRIDVAHDLIAVCTVE